MCDCSQTLVYFPALKLHGLETVRLSGNFMLYENIYSSFLESSIIDTRDFMIILKILRCWNMEIGLGPRASSNLSA